MKASTPRWIAFGTLALLAAISVLTASDLAGQAIGCVLLLGLLGIGILVGREKSVISTAPAIALGWLLFGGLIVHNRPLDPEYLLESFMRLMDQLPAWGGVTVIALCAVQLFFRNSDNKFLIVLRYLVLLIFFYSTSVSPLVFQLLALIALLGLSFELRSMEYKSADGKCQRKRRVLSSLYLWLLLQIVLAVHGYNVVSVLFANTSFSIYTILGVGLLGGLLIMEKAAESDVYYVPVFGNVGAVVLFWCATALLTLLIPALGNLDVLVLVPLVMFHLYHIFIKAWGTSLREKDEKTIFYVVWTLICVLILALSKSIYAENLLTAVFLVVAPLAAAICWSISTKKGGSDKQAKENMVSFLGVIAVIALAVSTRVDAADPVALAIFILSVALLCVFWCLVSKRIYNLDKTASKVDAEEFRILAKVQKFVPLIVIVVALFKILLATPDA